MTVAEYERLNKEEKEIILKGNGKLRVYQYMKDYKGITTREAFVDLGETRLSGRIYDLVKKDKLNIAHEDILVKNRYGKNCFVRKYWIA